MKKLDLAQRKKSGPRIKKISAIEPVQLEAFQHQKGKNFSSKKQLNWTEGAQFSRYRNPRDQSSRIEDQDASPTAGLWW